MHQIEIIFIALGLSMDCFAVAISIGAAKKINRRDAIRMSLFFGIFQGAMPLIGWAIGGFFKDQIEWIDHWVAFGILSFIGIKMVLQTFKKEHERKPLDIRKFSVLCWLSIATSMDALIVGFSFSLINVRIISAAVIITIITFLMSGIGAKLGERAHHISSKNAEIIGGVVLILIGVKILGNHIGFFTIF
jgi:manganese efflux pump family protein